MEEPLLLSTLVLHQGMPGRRGPHAACWQTVKEAADVPRCRDAKRKSGSGGQGGLWGWAQRRACASSEQMGCRPACMPGISPDKVLGSSLPQQSGSSGLSNQICPTTAQTRSGEGQGFQARPQGRSTGKACSHKVQSHPDLLSQPGRWGHGSHKRADTKTTYGPGEHLPPLWPPLNDVTWTSKGEGNIWQWLEAGRWARKAPDMHSLIQLLPQLTDEGTHSEVQSQPQVTSLEPEPKKKKKIP